jgi:hypothetical protein
LVPASGGFVEIVVDVSAHKKIEPAVAVIIAEGRAGVIDGHAAQAFVERHAGFLRHIGKRAVWLLW